MLNRKSTCATSSTKLVGMFSDWWNELALKDLPSLILAKFTNALVKSRPLKEIGAEQLLIDLQAIKAFLMKLPGDLQTATYEQHAVIQELVIDRW